MPDKTVTKKPEPKLKHRSVEADTETKQKTEMADAHCHLDLIADIDIVRRSIGYGVETIVTDGVNFQSSKRAIELANMDGRHIFAACGVDPETATRLDDDALDEEIENVSELVAQNKGKVVAIGEIGLDYTKAVDDKAKARQQSAFERMLDLAKRMDLPVSVHSRESMTAVLMTLRKKEMKNVHLHFFEGSIMQAKEAEMAGYMISIPPIESTKRRAVAHEVSIDRLMAESDSPVVGESPAFVEKSIRMIAEMKAIPFEKAAEALTLNTKKFFNISAKPGVMRT